ncbi:hypothetical protein [Nostocoides veronense]|uniref:Uncharacterized protein n=1 Tax=Nostocoides veronense TaxID=330836 RepID=A0ABP4Y1V3_9MICO
MAAPHPAVDLSWTPPRSACHSTFGTSSLPNRAPRMAALIERIRASTVGLGELGIEAMD